LQNLQQLISLQMKGLINSLLGNTALFYFKLIDLKSEA
jgi:hypothetical protein